MSMAHILILGGTGDARRLAERLTAAGGTRVTLSLAGRTVSPLPQAGEVRSGGFGGPEGLAAWIAQHGVDVLVDATHPFAARISANARNAARISGVPLVALERPAWRQEPGDFWIAARDIAHAAALIGDEPKTVFLAIGRQELAPFAAHPQHAYLVRSVDPVAPGILPGARFLLDRGPFDEAAEHRLLQENGVGIVVTKNSGGAATYGKIAAARVLGLPVIMVARPAERHADPAATVDEALARLHQLVPPLEKRGE